MERCTLCGGRLVNGRCTGCGLDNTKNDRKYHLNTHNEKSAALFHRGDCEDHLNKDNGYGDNLPWRRRKQPATAGLESYQRRRAASGASAQTEAPESSAQIWASESSAQAWTQESSAQAWASGTSSRTGASESASQTWASGTSAEARTLAQARAAEGSSAARMPQGMSQSAASGKAAAERRRELKKRSQTGTVRRKSRAGTAVKLIFLFFILLFVVFPIVAQKVIEYRRGGGSFNIFGGNAVHDEGPEEISWDEEDDRYYGIALDPGVYEVGYDLPAGEYQLCCAGETVDLCWQEADADEYDYSELTLYSPERQETYRDFWDEDCPYHQYSDRIALSEGTMFVVETGLDSEGVELEGYTDPGAVRREREPQPGLEEVQVEDGLIAGKDFPVGVYNLMIDNADDEYSYSSISVQIDRDGKTIDAGADSYHPVFWHIPFTGGEEIKLIYLNVGAGAHLVPSF